MLKALRQERARPRLIAGQLSLVAMLFHLALALVHTQTMAYAAGAAADADDLQGALRYLCAGVGLSTDGEPGSDTDPTPSAGSCTACHRQGHCDTAWLIDLPAMATPDAVAVAAGLPLAGAPPLRRLFLVRTQPRAPPAPFSA